MADNEGNTKGEQTRRRIIQAAYHLFLQQGFHGTSMRQIATASGIALGGIYNHFVTKEDIFKAVWIAHHPYHELLPAILDARADNAETLVRSAASLLVQTLQTHPDFLNLSFIEVVEFKSVHFGELLNEITSQSQIFLQFLQTYQAQLRPIPPALLLRSFIGLFFSYTITASILSSAPQFATMFSTQSIDQFVDIYLHGILAEKGKMAESQDDKGEYA